jgi:hypothetical protein
MSSTTTSGGMGFLSTLGLIFIVLKLVGVINWSWWLVLLPIYGGIIVGILIFAVVIIYLALWDKYH